MYILKCNLKKQCIVLSALLHVMYQITDNVMYFYKIF